jgi:hypothetical protein
LAKEKVQVPLTFELGWQQEEAKAETAPEAGESSLGTASAR